MARQMKFHSAEFTPSSAASRAGDDPEKRIAYDTRALIEKDQ